MASTAGVVSNVPASIRGSTAMAAVGGWIRILDGAAGGGGLMETEKRLDGNSTGA
jgi:hypothetical protein